MPVDVGPSSTGAHGLLGQPVGVDADGPDLGDLGPELPTAVRGGRARSAQRDVSLVPIHTECPGDPGHGGLDPVGAVARRQAQRAGAEGHAGATDQLQLVEIGIRHPTM